MKKCVYVSGEFYDMLIESFSTHVFYASIYRLEPRSQIVLDDGIL